MSKILKNLPKDEENSVLISQLAASVASVAGISWTWVDAAGIMYQKTTLTDDTSWNDLDFTGISNGAPAGSTEAIIRVYAIDNVVGSNISFRKNGNTTGFSVQRRYIQGISQAIGMTCHLPLDENGNVEIQISPKPSEWTSLFIYLIAYK